MYMYSYVFNVNLLILTKRKKWALYLVSTLWGTDQAIGWDFDLSSTTGKC